MASVQRYKAGVSFFTQNLIFSPAPGVPLCQARVDVLVAYYFKEPAPYRLIIAVTDVSSQASAWARGKASRRRR